jgi:hypothetical protein
MNMPKTLRRIAGHPSFAIAVLPTVIAPLLYLAAWLCDLPFGPRPVLLPTVAMLALYAFGVWLTWYPKDVVQGAINAALSSLLFVAPLYWATQIESVPLAALALACMAFLPIMSTCRLRLGSGQRSKE